MIGAYCGGIDQFVNSSNMLSGSAYGYAAFTRSVGHSQFDLVKRELLGRPNTKRALILLAHQRQLQTDQHDLACAIGIQFFPRNGALHASVMMRANNATSLLQYNVFEMTMLQEWVAQECGFTLGEYSHYVASLHTYEPNTIARPKHTTPLVMAPMPRTSLDDVRDLQKTEIRIRESNVSSAKLDRAVLLIAQHPPYWKELMRVLLLQRLWRSKSVKLIRRYCDSSNPIGAIEQLQRELVHQNI